MQVVSRLFISIVACAGLSVTAAELRSADVHPDDNYPTVTAVKHMGAVLDKASGGKLKIKVFNKGALADEKGSIELLKNGTLDMSRVNVTAVNALCPLTMVPTLPFLFRSEEHMHKVLDGPVGEEILKSCEANGLVGLAFYDSGSRSVYSQKPIKSMEDIKGLKIRVQPSEMAMSMAQAMGAVPTPMPYAEVHNGLKSGLVDAAENNIPSFDTAKHAEVVKVYSRTQHSMAPEMLYMSKAVWDKLTKAEQDMVRAAAKESVTFQRKAWDEQEKKSLESLKKQGVQFVDVEKAMFQAAMIPVYAKFMSSPDQKRLVKAVQDTK